MILNIVIKIVVNSKFGIVWIIFKIKCEGIEIYFWWMILLVYNNVIGIEMMLFNIVFMIVIWIVFNIGVVICCKYLKLGGIICLNRLFIWGIFIIKFLKLNFV